MECSSVFLSLPSTLCITNNTRDDYPSTNKKNPTPQCDHGPHAMAVWKRYCHPSFSTNLKSLLIWNFGLSCFTCFLLLISLASPNWLDTREGNRFFSHAGLWVACFKQLPDPTFRYPTIINGCWHLFNENVWNLRDKFMPRTFLYLVNQITVDIQTLLSLILILPYTPIKIETLLCLCFSNLKY